MNIDERALGPQIGQAINLAFNEQLKTADTVDLSKVRERAKEIMILNVQLNIDVKKALGLDNKEK